MREKVAVDAAEKDGANEESNQQSLAMCVSVSSIYLFRVSQLDFIPK